MKSQPFHFGHFSVIGGNARDDLFKVLGSDGIGHGNRLGRTQPFPQIRGHDAVDFKAVDFLIATDCPGDIFPRNPVNHPGIGTRPVKQYLQLDRQGAHSLRHGIGKLRRIDLLGGEGSLAKAGWGREERQCQKPEDREFFHVNQRDKVDFVPGAGARRAYGSGMGASLSVRR